jgi:hypothetical protein
MNMTTTTTAALVVKARCVQRMRKKEEGSIFNMQYQLTIFSSIFVYFLFIRNASVSNSCFCRVSAVTSVVYASHAYCCALVINYCFCGGKRRSSSRSRIIYLFINQSTILHLPSTTEVSPTDSDSRVQLLCRLPA